jgi:hypothetical protein
MFGRAERVWLRPAIFFGAVCGIAIFSPPRASAQSEGSDSISALPTPSGPDESSPAADYVRKPTDPPPFNAKSPQAIAARKRAAAEKPRLAEVPTTDGTAVVAPPGSAKVLTSEFPVTAAKPAIPIPSTATPPFAPGPSSQPSSAAAPGAAPVTATPFAAPTTATPFAAPTTATPLAAPAPEAPPTAPLTAPPTNPAASPPPSAAPPGPTVVPLYATPLPASPPETAAAPEAATPPAAATPPEEAAPPVGAAPPGAPVAAPESAAEAPEAPTSGRPANVVGVDSYGQTSAPGQLPPQPIGQPAATPVPDNGALPPSAAPTSLPPSDVPQGPPPIEYPPQSPQGQ